MADVHKLMIDPLEPRRLFSAAPVAINFNDEALWDANFATAAAQAKSLGVQSVRLWFGFTSYDSRPNAWDPVSPYGAITAGEVAPEDAHTDALPQTMLRAFQLKKMGFNVMVVLQSNTADVPASADQAKGFVRHLMDATETPDSTTTLKDIVDYWEIGNEPDSGTYWTPSATNKVAGLKSYVDDWLIPAAEELHSGTQDQWAKVISAGVSYSPADLYTVLSELKTQNALDDIDYAGFHAYGVVNSTTNDIARYAAQAVAYGKTFGKSLIATEWNVRGLGNTGANDATWAATMDGVYRTTIAPSFQAAYYFALVNNWAARGGSTSARPAGLLKHDTRLAVTPASPILTLRDYFNSPLITADPFYSTFNGWQFGQVSGVVSSQSTPPPGTTLAGITVYIDVDHDGKLDAGEPATQTNSAGGYTLRYSDQQIAAGTYTLAIAPPSGLTGVVGAATISVANLANTTGVNFTVLAAPLLGSIGGALWNDADGDGLFDGTDSYTSPRVVYLDANRNGKLDAGETQVTSDASGNYVFKNLPAGTYYVTRVFPTGYHLSNAAVGYIAVTVAAGQAVKGVNLGSSDKTAGGTPPSTTDGGTAAAVGTASIAGKIFAQSSKYAATMLALPWVAYLDTNNDGVRESNETSVKANADGTFAISGIAAGTYWLRLTPQSGWSVATPASGALSVTVKAGTAKTGQNFVIKQGAAAPAVPAGTASIAGKLFAPSKSSAAMLAQSWTAYLDLNTDGVYDTGDLAAAVSHTDGSFAFTNLSAGSYVLALSPKSGWTVTTPTTKSFKLTLTAGQAKSGQNFVLATV